MTSLIACLSSGKGTWAHVARLINAEEWEHVFLVTNEFGKDRFKSDGKTSFIIIDDRQGIGEMVALILSQLENKIIDTEVAVNLASGTGKEHMAVMSAVLRLGLALRLVYCGEDGNCTVL